MKKIICSPGSYIQGKGEIKELNSYFELLGSKGAYIVVDGFIYDNYKQDIEKSFVEKGTKHKIVRFGGECCVEEIKKHQENLEDCDVVIGIGGGKTIDTSKATAYYEKLPVIIVPTAASSDAPCSRLSVVYKKNGEFDFYLPLTSNPNIVVMDTEVISKAPVRFLMAGIGDALATYYEAEACRISNASTMAGGKTTKAAINLAKLCKETLLADGLKAKLACENKVCTTALENVIEANTYLSGIGFESSGLAAAHAIHNGLTVIEELHHLLHGEKVAFGTLVQLVLENRELEEIREIIEFCRECNLPTSLKDMGIENISDEKLMEVAKLSCAEGETIHNMPFKVTPENVFAAIKTADKLGRL